jgi:hypothetical protein
MHKDADGISRLVACVTTRPFAIPEPDIPDYTVIPEDILQAIPEPAITTDYVLPDYLAVVQEGNLQDYLQAISNGNPDPEILTIRRANRT